MSRVTMRLCSTGSVCWNVDIESEFGVVGVSQTNECKLCDVDVG